MSGPPPRPIELSKRLGDPGHRLNQSIEPAHVGEALDVAPPPPSDLYGEAVEMWEFFTPLLVEAGGMREVDVPALRQMCLFWQRAEQARKVLEEQGQFVAGSTGQMTEHPAVKMEREAGLAFLKIVAEFGGTWIARSRLGLNEAGRASLLAGLQRRLGGNPRASD